MSNLCTLNEANIILFHGAQKHPYRESYAAGDTGNQSLRI